jgi:hypothetical protein
VTAPGRRLAAAALAWSALACGGGATTPAPIVSPPPSASPAPGDVIPGAATGPTRITFLAAEPPPGANVSGCGATAAGCAGRVRVRLRLEPAAGGPVLYVRVFLHSTTLRACLFGQTGAQVLSAGRPADVEVVLDQADECRTPSDIRTMAAVVEGTVEVASRQEWRIVYTLSP